MSGRIPSVCVGVGAMTLGVVLLVDVMPARTSPTDGWTQRSWTYTMHKPYNLSLSQRFSYSNGVWTTWVFKTDAPMAPGKAGSRTELRWNNNYSSGRRMWDGDIFLVAGTNEATIQQVFGGTSSATSSQIRGFTAAGGTLKRYGSNTLVTGINNTWVNVKVAHDTVNNTVTHYVRNAFVRSDPDRGNTTYYFKNGVYVGSISSNRSECRFRNLRQWAR